jgi:hypothetical protein
MQIKTDEELWEILGSVDKFNIFLSNYTEFITRKVMLAAPALVIHHIKNEQNYNRIKEKFFIDNPELVIYKPVVAQELNKIAANHADWDIEKVFTQAGIEAKKIIKQSLEKKDGQKL